VKRRSLRRRAAAAAARRRGAAAAARRPRRVACAVWAPLFEQRCLATASEATCAGGYAVPGAV
jgi:hypothetical protein